MEYVTHFESGENCGCTANGTSTSCDDARLRRCSTGFASFGSVLLNCIVYATHLPSALMTAALMVRHLV